MKPLSGMRVVSLAVYVPGPIAAARLREMGASIGKIEPPGGDPLQLIAPAWYAELAAGQTVSRLDLKDPAGRAELDAVLAGADLLLTATRPAALQRLGLGWTQLHARHPALCHVAVVGERGARTERPGHDLTYQASAGLLDPPGLPRTLLADLAGAERAVTAALALLLARDRGAEAARVDVALSEAAAAFALPFRHGLTAPGGLLGGGEPAYGIYRASEGWVAVAALEPHFRERLARELGVKALSADELGRVFHTRTAAEWEAWAAERDLPLAAVRGRGTCGDRDATYFVARCTFVTEVPPLPSPPMPRSSPVAAAERRRSVSRDTSFHAVRLQSARRAFSSEAQLAAALGVNRAQVKRWREGETEPGPENADRIVGLDATVELLSGYLEPESIPKWLHGFNAHLGDRRPIDLLRQGNLSEVVAAIEALKSGSYA